MLAIALGNALCLQADIKAARKLLRGRDYLVIAANDAGYHYRGRLDAWASLHPDRFPEWMAKRKGNQDYRAFGMQSDKTQPLPEGVEAVTERWRASSGIYQAQVAIQMLGCSAAILCGVPLSNEAGHIRDPDWNSADRFKAGCARMKTEVGGKVRSMSGWTKEHFGAPTAAWIDKAYR